MVNSDNTGFNINFNAGKESSRERTYGPRKSSKNFEKVMRKEERHQRRRDEEDAFVKDDDKKAKTKDAYDKVVDEVGIERKSTKQKMSIFDLQSGATEKVPEKTTVFGEFPKEIHKESLSALFKGFGDKEKLESLQIQVKNEPHISLRNDQIQQIVPESSLEEVATLYKEEKPNIAPKFSTEQPDLSSINPMAPALPSESVSTSASVQRANQIEMQEIVDQIVAKLYTLKVGGQTDTTIALRHPPLFAGAQLVVSAFDSARGEFNITFENLTQAAKQFLELQENQGALRNALEQKGFVLHILTATTTMESRPIVEEGRPSQGEREGSEEHAGREGKEDREERQG